ncbi:hypothetical protein MOO44_00430 (plasmid) [Nicoliella spurrieriana]|uniref:Uncharacterized protein n=1 Tax=Nicoliella spurrieriana TaxID=2925830 RepID=A0A976X4V7_9LACO|nr:hypothetical protein [Nicoliella spurrieriana]UQS86144.1 hypothetical protein MOO44_00430 [Nicoliella spurrieriana]
MKKQIFATVLVAGILSPLFAFGNVANASTKPTLKPSVSYNSGKISFKGSASNANVKKVVIKKGSSKFATATLKSKKFTVSKTYSGKNNFTVYGTSKAGKKLTKSYTIKSSQYVTATPTYYSIDRSQSGKTIVKLYAENEKNVTFYTKFNGYDYSGFAESGLGTITYNYPANDYTLSAYAVAKNKEASATVDLPEVTNGQGQTNPEILPF